MQEAQERCAELRVMIPHATYASYAAVDYLERAASIERLHIHIREGGSMEALDHVLRQGYHLALLRYAVEDDEHYTHYCARRGLKMEPIMDFEYSLLTNRDGPLARKEIRDLSELDKYHLVLKRCPAQRQQMRDVLVYPDKGRLRPEEQAFVDLLHKEAASTVK